MLHSVHLPLTDIESMKQGGCYESAPARAPHRER
jgi:hypothetical protein